MRVLHTEKQVWEYSYFNIVYSEFGNLWDIKIEISHKIVRHQSVISVDSFGVKKYILELT